MNTYKEDNITWEMIVNMIFPNGIPIHCEWEKSDEIILVLNAIGSIPNVNHMFYPNGGGLDVISASNSNERGCIEIFTGTNEIFKPKKLIFESFKESYWNYFRLELYELKPIEICVNSDMESEELLELEPGCYLSRNYWDIGEYNGVKLPSTARLVTRYMKGSFVIFSKYSPYNENSNTCDGPHDNFTSEEFRKYIENVIEQGWSRSKY